MAHTVIRFQVAGLSGTVTSAKLRLFVNNPSTDGPAISRSTGAWTESGVTWNNRPAPPVPSLGDLGAVNTGSWVEYNLTSTITANGTYDFVLTTGSADGMTFHSREGTQHPQPWWPRRTTDPDPDPDPSPASSVNVTLTPPPGVTGSQRVNFAVPLAAGQLTDPNQRARARGRRRAARGAPRARALIPTAAFAACRSRSRPTVERRHDPRRSGIGETPTTAALSLVAVSTTLDPADGTHGPARVGAPAGGVAVGERRRRPAGPRGRRRGHRARRVGRRLRLRTNRHRHAFLPLAEQQGRLALRSRHRDVPRLRATRRSRRRSSPRIARPRSIATASPAPARATRIGVPGAVERPQVPLHAEPGDPLPADRRRSVPRERRGRRDARRRRCGPARATPAATDFWTERHAGFALLAYEWARDRHRRQAAELERARRRRGRRVPRDAGDATRRAGPIPTRAASRTPPTAHGEGYGTWGCSPWMSAILADGLDAYATETRRRRRATAARAAIVKLGTIIARDGRDSTGKPYYWMGVGSGRRRGRRLRRALGRVGVRRRDGVAPRRQDRRDARRPPPTQLVAGLQAHGEVAAHAQLQLAVPERRRAVLPAVGAAVG